LALVAAVARLHGAEASLHDAAPGLEARVVFAYGARTLQIPNPTVSAS
jgi:hypothetical protein